jgi:hypothetical protein
VPTLTLKLTLVTGSTFTLLKARVTSVRCSEVTLTLVELEVLPVVFVSLPGREAELLLFVPDAPPVVLLFVPLVVVPLEPEVPAELLPDVVPDAPDAALSDVGFELPEVVPDVPEAALPEVEPEVLPDVAPEDPPDDPPLGATVVEPPVEEPPDPDAPPEDPPV